MRLLDAIVRVRLRPIIRDGDVRRQNAIGTDRDRFGPTPRQARPAQNAFPTPTG